MLPEAAEAGNGCSEMTRKDYKLIAGAIQRVRRKIALDTAEGRWSEGEACHVGVGVLLVERALARDLELDNPLFNVGEFHRACVVRGAR